MEVENRARTVSAWTIYHPTMLPSLLGNLPKATKPWSLWFSHLITDKKMGILSYDVI